jgi:hypothetical protein
MTGFVGVICLLPLPLLHSDVDLGALQCSWSLEEIHSLPPSLSHPLL